jgi:probable H4MPT-linked C1 transfer pathway protein
MTAHSARRLLGIDIGGANIKYAFLQCNEVQQPDRSPVNTRVEATSTFFPMWKKYDKLADQLVRDLQDRSWLELTACGITMTGELADCFFDRVSGVKHIVNQVSQAFERLALDSPLFYAVDGGFLTAEASRGAETLLAASNWHALGSYVARTQTKDCYLIDIGSTTADLIPIAGGTVATSATTDFERLAEGSLVYVGGERTSVAMLVDTLTYRGQMIPVMREHFATMADVRLLLGKLPESDTSGDTADGTPFNVRNSTNRLARLIGLSEQEVNQTDAVRLAEQIHQTAKAKIQEGLQKLTDRYGSRQHFIISGHADDLISLPAASTHTRLSNLFGHDGSRNAPAVATARLLGEQLFVALRQDANPIVKSHHGESET